MKCILMMLLMCTACSTPPARIAEKARVTEVTVAEVQHILAIRPPAEDPCMDLYAAGRRSCFPGDIAVPGDVHRHATGGLQVEGFGLKDDALAVHFSDRCSHYLCGLDRACMNRVGDPDRYQRECVNYDDCCVAMVDR